MTSPARGKNNPLIRARRSRHFLWLVNMTLLAKTNFSLRAKVREKMKG